MRSGNYDANDDRYRNRQSAAGRGPQDRHEDDDWRMQEQGRERGWDSEVRGRGVDREHLGRGDDRNRRDESRTHFMDGRDMNDRGSGRGEWLRADEPAQGRYRGDVQHYHGNDPSRTSDTYGRQSWSRGSSGERAGSWGHQDMEPEDSNWTRQQGLYGSNEYGGWLGGQYRQGTSPEESRSSNRARVQGHAGKGPKGWQRSDERLKEEVCEALARHPGIDASDIEVQVNGCEVTLAGSVGSRADKRLAEDVIDSVYGVQEVHNQLRVKREQSQQGMEAGADRQSTTGTPRSGSGSEERGRKGSGAAG